MDTYHKNLEVIARGKGSSQARYEDELCRSEGWELNAEEYLAYLWEKNENNRLRPR